MGKGSALSRASGKGQGGDGAENIAASVTPENMAASVTPEDINVPPETEHIIATDEATMAAVANIPDSRTPTADLTESTDEFGTGTTPTAESVSTQYDNINDDASMNPSGQKPTG